jgi:hypothetical protein
MLRRIFFLLFCLLLVGAPAQLSQERPQPISLVRLLANPQEFDGKIVFVRGFLLVVGAPHDLVDYSLYLHREDAENNLGNSVVVVPNENMIRDREKIDRMYIQLAGTVRTRRVSGQPDSYISSIRDITSYSTWSDPNHPRTLKLLDQKHN